MDKAEAIERLGYQKARAQIALEQEVPEWIAEDLLGTIEAYDMAIEALQTEPKRGEWIQKPHKVYLPRDCEPLFEETYNEADHSTVEYWWHCNQCDYEADRLSKPTFKFCPNCGCRMKGKDNE